jgi:hypothetical protein
MHLMPCCAETGRYLPPPNRLTLQITLLNCYFTGDNGENKFQTVKFSNPIGLKKTNLYAYTHNPILLIIENNAPFLPFRSIL